MLRAITTQEATVKTATVEIKTLTISGKQMTLAVFRQLQEEVLLDRETLQLCGIPWGRVNYHPDCKEIEDAHLHVVWQKGGELRRSCVRSRGWEYSERARRIERDIVSLGSCIALELGREERPNHRLGNQWEPIGSYISNYGYPNLRYKRWEGRCLIEDAELVSKRWSFRSLTTSGKNAYQKQLVESCQKWQLWASSAYGIEEVAEYIAAYGDLEADYEAIKSEWASQYQGLSALDQLFIAV